MATSGLTFAAALAAAATIPLLAPPPAQALVVTVGGQEWTVSTVTGAFGDGTNVGGVDLTNPANAPWWMNQTLAASFAEEVGDRLGLSRNTGISSFLTGPNFAWMIGVGAISGPSILAEFFCLILEHQVQTYPLIL